MRGQTVDKGEQAEGADGEPTVLGMSRAGSAQQRVTRDNVEKNEST